MEKKVTKEFGSVAFPITYDIFLTETTNNFIP